MKDKADKRKITVQLWGPLLQKLNQMTTEACLNRDAYLDVVFASEATMLVRELDGKRNSDPARAHIKRCFAELKDLRPVSFNLCIETAESLTGACDRVNLWRDVFVNRVIYLLVAKSSAIEHHFEIEFDHQAQNAVFEEGWEIKALLLGPRLSAIRQFIVDDPFLGIRAALRDTYPDTGGALHAVPLGNPLGETPRARGLAGFSAFLEDKHVAGTKENEEWTRMNAELLSLL
jgi:hypothetical protein